MKIGIVSDTHGDAARLARALERFAQRGVEAVVHCGDIGSAECVRLLGRCGAAACLAFGNMDRLHLGLHKAAEREGVAWHAETVEVALGEGRHLVATHGHDANLLAALIAGGQFPYICCGHTHRRRNERIGQVRVINPGALHHPRDGKPSVAVLDTEADEVEFVNIE